MSGSGGEDWGPGSKDRQQATFIQPEQSYEAAFNKVWPSSALCTRDAYSTVSMIRVTSSMTLKLIPGEKRLKMHWKPLLFLVSIPYVNAFQYFSVHARQLC